MEFFNLDLGCEMALSSAKLADRAKKAEDKRGEALVKGNTNRANRLEVKARKLNRMADEAKHWGY